MSKNEQIEEQRNFVAEIWTAQEYKDIQTSVSFEIDSLLKKIYEFVRILDEKNIISRFHSLRMPKDSSGLVRPNIADIKRVVFTDGNIREKMTLIFSFGRGSCDLLWNAIISYIKQDETWLELRHLLSEQDLKRRIATIEFQMGLDVRNMIDLCEAQNCKQKGTLLYDKEGLCRINRFNKYGPVHFTRIAIKPVVRFPNNETVASKRFINESQIIPALSSREWAWLTEHNLTLTDETTNSTQIKWMTGYAAWSPNEESIYSKMATKYNRLSIAGPSGNTDLHLDVSLSFQDTDLFNNFMACVVWMGNPPHHSVHELLLATKASEYKQTFYQSINQSSSVMYDMTQDPYQFIFDQINLRRHDTTRWVKNPQTGGWMKAAVSAPLPKPNFNSPQFKGPMAVPRRPAPAAPGGWVKNPVTGGWVKQAPRAQRRRLRSNIKRNSDKYELLNDVHVYNRHEFISMMVLGVFLGCLLVAILVAVVRYFQKKRPQRLAEVAAEPAVANNV